VAKENSHFPDGPSLPHSINAIFEAAQWILRIHMSQNSSAMLPMHSPVIPIIECTLFDPIAIQTTPERPLAPPASDTGYIKSDELTAMLRSISATIIDSLSTQTSQEPSTARSEPLSSPVAPKSMFSTRRTDPDVSALLPAASPSFSSDSTSLPIDLPTCATPKRSDKVQTRIDAIQDELRALRAQCDDPTAPTVPIRSAMRSKVISSPITPSHSTTTAPSTISDKTYVLDRISMQKTPSLFPVPLTSFPRDSTSFSTASTANMIPKLSDKLRTQTDMVEDKLCVFRAKCDDPTVSLRSAMHPNVISSPSTPSYDTTTAPTALSTLSDQVDVSSIFDRISSISSPTSFPIASSSFSSDSMSFSTTSTTNMIPELTDKVQTQIDAIEDKLCVLQTQSDDSTDPARSTTRSDAISTPSMRLYDSTTDPTVQTAPIRSTMQSRVISSPSTQFYDNSNDPTNLTRSATRHDVVASPLTCWYDSTTDPTAQTAPIRSMMPSDASLKWTAYRI